MRARQTQHIAEPDFASVSLPYRSLPIEHHHTQTAPLGESGAAEGISAMKTPIPLLGGTMSGMDSQHQLGQRESYPALADRARRARLMYDALYQSSK
jgi:hypothetical protein